jgi:hypothetical protein
MQEASAIVTGFSNVAEKASIETTKRIEKIVLIRLFLLQIAVHALKDCCGL